MPQPSLQNLRSQIDALDSELCSLIGKRMGVSRQMKGLKHSVTDTVREKEIRQKWKTYAANHHFSEQCAEEILQAILTESKHQQT